MWMTMRVASRGPKQTKKMQAIGVAENGMRGVVLEGAAVGRSLVGYVAAHRIRIWAVAVRQHAVRRTVAGRVDAGREAARRWARQREAVRKVVSRLGKVCCLAVGPRKRTTTSRAPRLERVAERTAHDRLARRERVHAWNVQERLSRAADSDLSPTPAVGRCGGFSPGSKRSNGAEQLLLTFSEHIALLCIAVQPLAQ